MKDSTHSSGNYPDNHRNWETYKQLELLSDSTPDTEVRWPLGLQSFVQPLWQRWLDDRRTHRQTQQPLEYLERCWSLDESGEPSQPLVGQPLNTLWMLIS